VYGIFQGNPNENPSIKMSTAWQRNLRRSEGTSNLPRAIGIKNQNKNNVGVQVSKKTTKRLSSVSEATADDVFGDENMGIKRPTVANRGNRRRLSTKGSVSEVDNGCFQKPSSKEVKSRVLDQPKSPQKIAKAQSFLRPIPKLAVPFDDTKVKNVPSPIPLPKGVTNIDPDDESTESYGRDIFNYVLVRDAKYIVTTDDIISKEDPKIEDRREHLVDWLISVSHFFKCSQETLYHTVDIVDRCLSKAKFKTEYLQLMGVASFFLATKLDEYHPAEISELGKLTDDSYSALKIRTMEQKILETIKFEVYGIEPMTFIRRYLKAAQLGQNMMIYELSILFMDAMVLRLWADKKDASTAKKAAVAVFTAIIVTSIDLEDSKTSLEKLWTPNMIYYVWSDYYDLVPMSRCSLKALKSILSDIKDDFAMTIKYKSVSRHSGLLHKLSYRRVADVEKFMEKLL
jgi:hypothetical protein